MTEVTPFLPGLSPIAGKSLTAAMDAGNLTSNGGLLMLREAANRLGLAAVIATPLPDARNPLLITHTFEDMATARMMAIAADYEDVDDLDALRRDPALMMACDRAPGSGVDLPSRPTISRLENLADVNALYRIGIGFIDLFLDGYATPPHSIVLDIDDTNDLVHGGQQLALFNTHAGGHCFQPMLIFEGNSGKPILSLMRPGKRPSGKEIARVLRHVIHRIRRRWPNVRILIRGDSHYCPPDVLDLLRRMGCDYILGLSINTRLDAIAKPWRQRCVERHWPGRTVRRMHQLTYRADSWPRELNAIRRDPVRRDRRRVHCTDRRRDLTLDDGGEGGQHQA